MSLKRRFDDEVAVVKRARGRIQYPKYSMVPTRRVYSVRQRNFPSARLSSRNIVERKYFDTTFEQALVAGADWAGTEIACDNMMGPDGTTLTAYTESPLIPSARGIGYGQVVGMSYYLDKIRVRAAVGTGIRVDQADVQVPQTVRFVLVMDTRPSGVQAQGEDIFPDMGSAAVNNHSFQTMALNANQFRILADKTFVVQPAIAGTDGTNTVSTCSQARTFKMSHTFKKPIRVVTAGSSTSPTVAALENCNIFLLAHTDDPADPVSVAGCARAYYHE